jgi:hypothetical protein
LSYPIIQLFTLITIFYPILSSSSPPLQSKALELVFADYIAAQTNGWESVKTSPAPLRNFLKDFACIGAELPGTGTTISNYN